MEAAAKLRNTTECPAPGGINSRHNSSLLQSLEFIPYSVHTVRLLVPLWLALGVPGSLLSLAVWGSRRMRSSSSVYLCALALLDALFLLLQQLPWHLQEYYGVPMLHNAPMCRMFPVYNMWLQYLSPVLILAFTVERYIGICHPFSSDKLCTVRRAAVTTGCLAGGCLLLGLVQLHFYGYNPAARLCSEDERILTPGSPQNRFYNIWTKTTEVLFFAVAPLAILAFNLLVLAQVRRAARASPARQLRQHQQRDGRKGQPTAATVTLLSVSFYQIGVMMPVSALLFASISLASTDLEGLTCNLTDAQVRERMRDGRLPQLRAYFTHAAATNIVSGLAVSHNAVKFFVYLATGTLFRRELLRLLCPRRLAAAVGVTEGDIVGNGGGECAALSLPSRRTSEQRRRLRQSSRAAEADAAAPPSPSNGGFAPEDKPLLKSEQRSWV